MAADTPTSVPAEITQGDTLKFSLALADYPASDGWALSFAFANADFQFAFATSADPASPDSHLASASSSGWTPGRYNGLGRVTLSGETFTVWRGSLLVAGNFLAIADTRSHARKCLDAVNAMLEGASGNELQQSSIVGETLTWKSVDELLKLRDYYARLVQAEEDAARIAQGLGNPKRILTRFTRPL